MHSIYISVTFGAIVIKLFIIGDCVLTHMVKERFSVSMDDDLVKWLDSMVDEKIFSSRSHALEFCVKQLSNMGIENIIMVHWGKNKKEPIFFSSADLKKLREYMESKNIPTIEEAILGAVNDGIEEMEKETKQK